MRALRDWEQRPGDHRSAVVLQNAVIAMANEIGLPSLAVRKAVARGRRQGLSIVDAARATNITEQWRLECAG